MHLSAGEILTRKRIHELWAMQSLLVMNSYFLVGYAIAIRVNFVGPIPAAMQQMIDYLLARAGHYSQKVMQWNLMDEYLFDIPLVEYLYRREYCPRLHLRLGDLPDNRTAIKMTGFGIDQQSRDAIEAYCQKDCLYVNHQGNQTLVPGLNELPFSICGFIDDTIDSILVHKPPPPAAGHPTECACG